MSKKCPCPPAHRQGRKRALRLTWDSVGAATLCGAALPSWYYSRLIRYAISEETQLRLPRKRALLLQFDETANLRYRLAYRPPSEKRSTQLPLRSVLACSEAVVFFARPLHSLLSAIVARYVSIHCVFRLHHDFLVHWFLRECSVPHSR